MKMKASNTYLCKELGQGGVFRFRPVVLHACRESRATYAATPLGRQIDKQKGYFTYFLDPLGVG